MVKGYEFSIAHINVRSLFTNFDIFKDHVFHFSYDIIAVTETWLSADVLDDAVYVHGYSIILKDRPTRAGGVAFYIKNDIDYVPFNLIQDNVEQLWIQIKVGKEKLALGVAYRPDWVQITNFFNALEESLAYVVPACDDLICVGDFNIDLLQVNSLKSNNFFEFIDVFGFKQIINSPTRITSTTQTLIDVIIVSNEQSIADSGAREMHGMSDHLLVFCKIKLKAPCIQACIRTYRDYKNFSLDEFNMNLELIPWNNILQLNNIDEKILFFNENLLQLYNSHVPVKTAKFTKPPAPWLTDTVKLMQKLRDNALKRFKGTKNIHHWNYYKSLRNVTTNAIRREKKAYLEYRFRNFNKKNPWKDLKTLSIYNKVSKSEIPQHLQDANKINNYFVDSVREMSIAPDTNLITFYTGNVRTNNVFSFKLVSEDEVAKIIRNIKSKSVGTDNIGIQLINLGCPFLIPYITHIVNFCLEFSVFPECWKIARIRPLPKTNVPVDFKDLRPISILPTFSKILERVMDMQLRAFLNEHNLLPETQSGFRAGYSCTTALTNILDDILTAIDTNKLTALVLLDFSKAFDTLNHKMLLSILHYVGISNDAISLFKNYLSDRTQVVQISNQKSDYRSVGSGVPQGSILGPLLYTVYTSNLGSVCKSCFNHFYADDTQVYYSFDSEDVAMANNIINTETNNLINMAEKHSLIINPSKSQVMLFGRRKARKSVANHLAVVIKNTQLPVTDLSRNLGLYVDSELRFKKHVSLCIQKAYSNLKFIYLNRHILSKETKTVLVEALVLSQFNFCDTVYGPCLDSVDVIRVQRIQNCCLRLIFGLRRRDHVSHKLKELHWLNMLNRRKMHSFCLFHKIITSETPPYLFKKINFRTDVHNLNLRNKGLITPPFHRTSVFQRSFTYNIAKLYNSLPLNFKNVSHIKFKKLVFSLLFDTQ